MMSAEEAAEEKHHQTFHLVFAVHVGIPLWRRLHRVSADPLSDRASVFT